MQALVKLADDESDAENAPGVKTWRDALVKVSGEISCEKCCAPASICQGGKEFLQDMKTVEQHGLCIKPLKTMFDDAKTITDFAYQYVHGKSLTGVALATELLGESPGLAAAAFFVGGNFRESVHGTPQVTLFVNPTEFSLRSFLVTVYVFVHELVSHAKCGIPTASEYSKISTEYSEGWMDWVATHLIRLVEGRCAVTSDGRLRWSDVASEAVNYHRMRIDPASGAVENVKNRAGALAAESLHFLFWGMTPMEGRESAFWLLAQFSMAVNASQATDERRGALVARVSSVLGKASTPAEAAVLAPVAWVAAIKRYATDKNHTKLLASLLR
ncbi:hypothetical protein [Paraburkholderia sp.]|uniref:hypothetical protein n=1 Tax=Paraburkholderia sp. TaxID=1926495 RepID=UPI003C7E82D4